MSDTNELPMVTVDPSTPVIALSRPLDEIAQDLGMVGLSNKQIEAIRDLSISIEQMGAARVVGGQMLVAQQVIVDVMLELRKTGLADPKKLIKVAHPIGYLATALAKTAETGKKLSVIQKAHDIDAGNMKQARIRRRKSLPTGPVQHIHATNVQINDRTPVEKEIEN